MLIKIKRLLNAFTKSQTLRQALKGRPYIDKLQSSIRLLQSCCNKVTRHLCKSLLCPDTIERISKGWIILNKSKTHSQLELLFVLACTLKLDVDDEESENKSIESRVIKITFFHKLIFTAQVCLRELINRNFRICKYLLKH